MEEFTALNVHLHPPVSPPYNGNNWVEQILGDIVKPLYEKYESHLDWLWITRYSGTYPDRFVWDYSVPPEYLGGIQTSEGQPSQWFRFVAFRASVLNEVSAEFQTHSEQLFSEAKFFLNPGGWAKFPVVEGLGNERFVHKSRPEEAKQHRARLIAKFVHYTVLLALSALEQDADGSWHFEPNDDENNPQGTFFQSVRHLFSNSIDLPFLFQISLKNDKFRLRAPYNNDFQPIEAAQSLSELIELEEEWLTLMLKL